MQEPVVYLNSAFVPASEASLNIYDLGIVLGVTFTEFTRTFAHKPFRLEDHVRRLYRSCKYGGLEPDLTPEDMLKHTRELVDRNCRLLEPQEDLGIVHFITAGENPIYAGSAAASARLTPTVCIHSFRMPFEAWSHLFTKGAHLVTPSIRHVPPQCVDPKTKNRSRIHWWLADQQAHRVDPEAISLLLDLDGNITECAGSNVLLYRDRTVFSPTSRNILLGISMQTVRELTEPLGLAWVEKDLQPYDVVNAEETWLATTPYCIAPATRINGIPIGEGRPGPVFHDIVRAWSDLVGLDILEQVTRSASDSSR